MDLIAGAAGWHGHDGSRQQVRPGPRHRLQLRGSRTKRAGNGETMGDSAPVVGPLRVGLVGCGEWGRLHAGTLRRLRSEGLVLIALCDSDPRALALASALCPGVPTFPDIENALAHSSAEAWICATSTASHAPVCKALLSAGRSVLCEEPLSHELAAAQSLDMYVQHGADSPGQGKLMVGHTGLFDSEFRALRAAAANKPPLSLINCEDHRPAASLNPARAAYSHQMAAFLPRFHPKQVHFEGCWLKGVAIYCAIRGGRSGRGG